MRSKLLSRRTLLLAIVAGCVLSAALLYYYINKSSAPRINVAPRVANIVPAPEQVSATISLPARLKIPAIGVDAAVEYMGLTADGAMDTPKVPENVGWYKLGQRPGEIGSAVITGHFGWKNGKAAAFDNLKSLQPGDTLFIEDDKGVSTTFVVRELKTYGKNDNSAPVFGSSDGKSHLNLITCEGTWDSVSKSYSKRLVVFTNKE